MYNIYIYIIYHLKKLHSCRTCVHIFFPAESRKPLKIDSVPVPLLGEWMDPGTNAKNRTPPPEFFLVEKRPHQRWAKGIMYIWIYNNIDMYPGGSFWMLIFHPFYSKKKGRQFVFPKRTKKWMVGLSGRNNSVFLCCQLAFSWIDRPFNDPTVDGPYHC